MKLSIIIPVYDEESSIEPLLCEIDETVKGLGLEKVEVVFVDDGSNDCSWAKIKELASRDGLKVRGVRHRRNFGKAAALQSGFDTALGDYIITMDADGQDDPREIPKLIEKLETGFDLVSGWKQKRNDPLDKVIPSRIFNFATRLSTGMKLHDFNCGYKIYRKEVARSLNLYGDYHRFIPVLAHANGFKVGETPVHHRARRFGSSKYGSKRLLKGALDLVSVVVLTRYLKRPGHFFGGLGILFGMIGFFVLAYLSINKLVFGVNIGMRPLFFMGILMLLFGSQFFSFGIIGELIVRQSPRKSAPEVSEILK